MPSDVLSIGRVGVDLYSLDYNTPLKDVSHFAKYVGGGAANLAVGLSRLGVGVGVVSGVADDELGEFVIEYLSREKVDTRCIVKFPDSKTGIVFAEVYPGKDSKFIFYRENAADLKITKQLVESAGVRDAKVLVTNGTALSADPSREASLYAMELAKENDRAVVFNLDWRPSLWKGVDSVSKLEFYSRAIELATILIGNDSEYMAATTSKDADEAISQIPDSKGKILIRTRGEHGSRAYVNGQIVDAAPYKVQSLKTLGAGDGNLAGIIYGYLNHWDMYRSLRFGNAIGAIVVTKHSCSDAMPTFEEATKFIEKMGGF
ncbi:MAG TPA: 5-dehydro-2-deoxygluconokinase [Nitrososphaerales archaeon]|nr:5-dehydro-2-deoxygluconokinase [Nitrososphaerales archaeon]